MSAGLGVEVMTPALGSGLTATVAVPAGEAKPLRSVITSWTV